MVKRQLTYESALARAASLCSRGEHAEAEMRRKLRQWGAETGDADRVVEWLVDNGFIDNSRYAHAFVYDKSRFDLWGRVKIRHQLRLNGVTGDVVEEAMAEIDEDEYVANLRMLLAAKSRTLTVADPYKRKASLMRYDGQAIRAFTARTHTTDQMVFSSIGNFSAKTAEAVAARYFASQPASQRGFVRAAPAPYRAFEKTVSKHTHQTHCIIGSRAFGISEDRRLPLALVTNILGGPCANSLLNIVVREKNGLSYNIEASYTPYGDTGIVAIYFSSDHSNAEQCIELIEGQLHKLRTVPLTARQLSMAKKQFIAQLAISSESNESYMLGAGKSLLVHDGIDTMEQVYAKVRALTARQLTEVAEEVFSDMSRLIYK